MLPSYCQNFLSANILDTTLYCISSCIFHQVIMAEGENKAARALADASMVISESPSALQLRYLQTLNAIAAEKNSTVIFPLPIDFICNFLPKNEKN